MSSHAIVWSVCLYLMIWSRTVLASTSMQKFEASSCGDLFKTADSIDRGLLEGLLPTLDFWDFFQSHNVTKKEVMLVDVDMHSWDLLLNQVVALKKSGSPLAQHVYAIAYDNFTCGNLTTAGVNCYYSASWLEQLQQRYIGQTGKCAWALHIIMLGRMTTSAVAICEGHNVFLTDTDVVFYQDPLRYAYIEADIMITATRINPGFTHWGGEYFTDLPGQVYTLNNGVVFYRSNPLMQNFVLTLLTHSINSLRRKHDVQQGFLQTTFNGMMKENQLLLHPSSQASNPNTYRLNTANLTNVVGECYDCYFGQFPYSSDVVQSPVVEGHPAVLKIGVFPLKRYTSFCWAPAG